MAKKRKSQDNLLPGMGDDAPQQPPAGIEAPPVSPTPVAPPEEPAIAANGLPELAGKTVYCIDANSLIFQVFHAIPEMTSPKGEPVNAVFGFTRDIFFLLDSRKPDYLFAAFDRSEPTFRDDLFPAYKATRSSMPEDLRPQFPMIRRMLAALGVPLLECPRFEADDILATVARIAAEQGGECFLVSGDKDCRQLLNDRVKIYNARKNQVYDDKSLLEDWGVRPEQVVDFQSLVGDKVDNVPGIAGIGPKTASQLLAEFGTLDNLLDRAQEVAGAKKQQNLIEGREAALLSRQLVRLDAHTPVEIDWRQGRAGGIAKQEALDLFREFGFHGFANKVRAMPDSPRATALPDNVALEDASLATSPPPAAASEWKATCRTVDTPEALAELVAEMARQPQISFDTETTHIWPAWAELVGLSFAWLPGEGYYVPVRAPAGERHLELQATLAALRRVLEDPQVKKVGQNLKYDLIVLRNAGIEVQGVSFDTMVASYLLDAGERNHNLDELAQRHLQHANIKIEQLIGSGKDQKRMDEVPVPLVAEYAAEDADVALRLVPILERGLHEAELEELFHSLEMPVVDVLVELESNGIRVDVPRLQSLSGQFGAEVARLEQEVYQLAGHPFNIGSPKQLQQILFVEQKLPVLRKTKTGPSTDVDVLEELALMHPLPAKIIEHRQFTKLKNTYVDALPQLVNPRTGRVHCSFNQVVAATGRLSSHDPNLQNIPIRTETGRAIRSAFLPGYDGWSLLAADYSQIELRVLAHYCQDPTLCQAFANDEDIHARVAGEVNGVPLEAVTGEMRRQAKAVNFGVIYGQSAFGLSKQLGIEKQAAERFIEAYFQRYAGVEVFLNKVLADCRANGYVKTIRGRRRAIAGVRPGGSRQRNPPERTAINTVIQGSAADLIKLAMTAVHRRLRRERLRSRMLLQIHDELVFEVPPEELAVISQLVSEEMSGVMTLSVPLKVDVKTGPNWAEV